MITVGIVDDEPGARGSLQKIIDKYLSAKIRVVFSAGSVKEAASQIRLHKPHMVFLDVEMPEENGFELFKHFENPDFKVVFTTAHKEYAINAIKHSALDYLLKPVNHMELLELIQKMETRNDNSRSRFQLETLLSNLNDGTAPGSRVAFPTHTGIEFVKVNNIAYCRADNNYTTLFTSLNESVIVTKTLKSVEELLPRQMFLRIHKSYLVNVNYIKSYNRPGQGIVLDNGLLLPVAASKAKDIITMLKNENA